MTNLLLDPKEMTVLDKNISKIKFTTAVSVNACWTMGETCMGCDGSCEGDCGNSCVGGCSGNGTNGVGD